VARRRVVTFVHARRNDEEVLEYRARGGHLDDSRRRIDAEILPEIDESVRAERRNQRAGPGVDGVDAIPHEVEDALTLGTFPVRDAAIPKPDDGSVVVSGRIEHPQFASGRRIERDRLQRRSRHVHDPVHHDGVHVHRRALVRVAGPILPRTFEPVNVGCMNLCDGRVLVAFRVAAVNGPVDILPDSRRHTNAAGGGDSTQPGRDKAPSNDGSHHDCSGRQHVTRTERPGSYSLRSGGH
jgi:hypothetical protein